MTEKAKRKITAKDIITFALMLGILLIVMAGLNYAKNNIVSQPILKTAIAKNSLESAENYIICQPSQNAEYPWLVIQDISGEKAEIYAVIDMGLSETFIQSANKFIFFISDFREQSSESLGENYHQYLADSWEVLFPVKRNHLFSGIRSNKYILESDTYDPLRLRDALMAPVQWADMVRERAEGNLKEEDNQN
jgi:hypothetical protein